MLRLAAFLTLAFLLTGCGAMSVYRGVVAERGADASDQTLESAEWVICNGVPVGAVKRRYATESKREAYNTICSDAWLP